MESTKIRLIMGEDRKFKIENRAESIEETDEADGEGEAEGEATDSNVKEESSAFDMTTEDFDDISSEKSGEQVYF